MLPAKRQVARECAGRASIARGANTAREVCGDVEADGGRRVESGRQPRDVKVEGQLRREYGVGGAGGVGGGGVDGDAQGGGRGACLVRIRARASARLRVRLGGS